MPDIVCLCIALALMGAIIFMLILQHKERIRWQAERKDLYDRIMSGSVDEYRLIKEPPQKPRVINAARSRRLAERAQIDALIGKERQET